MLLWRGVIMEAPHDQKHITLSLRADSAKPAIRSTFERIVSMSRWSVASKCVCSLIRLKAFPAWGENDSWFGVVYYKFTALQICDIQRWEVLEYAMASCNVIVTLKGFTCCFNLVYWLRFQVCNVTRSKHWTRLIKKPILLKAKKEQLLAWINQHYQNTKARQQ